MASSSVQNGPLSVDAAARHRNSLCIGDISVSLNALCEADIALDDTLARFGADLERCDIEIQVQWVDRIEPCGGRVLFDSGSVWKAFDNGSTLVFEFITPALGVDPYRQLHITRDFDSADLLLNRELLSARGKSISPLEYPLDELLFMHRLTRAGGVELHGCGLVDSELGGYLFLGHSGAGKSTTMRLWQAHRNVKVLSDDRIILRERDGEIWMYGTPWHGEPGVDDRAKSKINKILVLEHGKANEMSRLSPREAIGELFARSFVPFYDQQYLNSSLDFLEQVTKSVACFRYQFVPDASALEKVVNP